MPDLVLLPGMLCDERLWAHQSEHLAEGTRVHVGDLTRHDSVGGMAGAALDAAPERFALAGFSLGGIVAMEVMRRAPEHVEKLALVDTSARPPRQDQLAAWDGFASMTREGRFREVVEERLLPTSFHPDRLGDETLRATFVAMAASVGEEGFLRQLAAQRNRPDSRGSLPDIGCPVLVLGGREDRLCPMEVQGEVSSLVPGAEFVKVERCGHMSPLERPEAVTAALSLWLQER